MPGPRPRKLAHLAKLLSEMDREAREYLIGDDEELRKLVDERLQQRSQKSLLG